MFHVPPLGLEGVISKSGSSRQIIKVLVVASSHEAGLSSSPCTKTGSVQGRYTEAGPTIV